MMLNILLVLERNAVSIHKSEVRDTRLKLFAHRDRFAEALTKELGQPLESLSTLHFNVRGRGIAGEKCSLRMRVCRNPSAQAACQPWMTVKRSMLCARQKETRVYSSKQKDGHAGMAPSYNAVSSSRSCRVN